MPKSNRGGSFGRRSGTVTVIDEPVRRSSIRTAKIVFHVLWPVIGLLSATVLASKWHPILALLAGIGIGLVTAFIAAVLVAIWPVIRTLWWWAPELTFALVLVAGWVELADHTTLPYRIGVVITVTGVPAAIPPSPAPDHSGLLVPDHPAPYPGLLQRIHHHQPHRQPAAHLVGHPHPRRRTGLDPPAARPRADRPARPRRPDRGRLLG
jgi:hypothetical protein